jgi:hypothetical protein
MRMRMRMSVRRKMRNEKGGRGANVGGESSEQMQASIGTPRMDATYIVQSIQKQVDVGAGVRDVVEVVTSCLVVSVVLLGRVQKACQHGATRTENVVPVQVCMQHSSNTTTSRTSQSDRVESACSNPAKGMNSSSLSSKYARTPRREYEFVRNFTRNLKNEHPYIHFSRPSEKMSPKFLVNSCLDTNADEPAGWR